MFNFDLQRFGGKGGYQSSGPIIAELSPEQKRSIALQNQYLESISPILSNLVQQGHQALNKYSAPNFQKYYTQGVQTAINASNNAGDLAYGVLPSAYRANMSQAVDDAVSPYRQQFGSMGNNGTINSSLMRILAGDMSRGANAAANSAYNQNMSTASQLNAAYGQSAMAPLAVQSGFYDAQTQPAKDFLTLGTQTYQPTGQAANQAYQWQAALSAPAQNQYVQQPGLGGVFGSVLGGLAGNPALFCFPANTKIATANGDVNIQDVQVGDMVSTLVGEQEVTKTMQSIQPIMQINTDRGKLRCTETEVLLSVDGPVNAGDLINGDVLIHKDGGAIVYDVQFDVDECMVYEIVVPWFYADGFVIDGFDPEVE